MSKNMSSFGISKNAALVTVASCSVTALLACYAVPLIFLLCTNFLGRRLLLRTNSRREALYNRVKEDKARERYNVNTGNSNTSRTLGKKRLEHTEQDHAPAGSSDGRIEDSGHDQKADDNGWEGVIGFFHPFCNAGGGGERVLWAAIRSTQQRWPNAICIVYTGDHDMGKNDMLKRVEERFNIALFAPTIQLLYLTKRHYVLASTWPRFTLLGQSLGSAILAWEAFGLLVPDIFVDTMGYAFALQLSKLLFPYVPTGAYVHYPTISTDMLESLDSGVNSQSNPTSDENSNKYGGPEGSADQGYILRKDSRINIGTKGINAGLGVGWRGRFKKAYWQLFARLYGVVGGSVDVVMANSSWTAGHIRELWGPHRTKGRAPKLHSRQDDVNVVFPPTAVEELEQQIHITESNETLREPALIYVAQFRPEKNHGLVLRAFGEYMSRHHPSALSCGGETMSQTTNTNQQSDLKVPHLHLVGSVRNSADETHIYSLRLLAHELHITEHTTFHLNEPWPSVLQHLRTASVGVNAMWNEHFGIGVVEYQAAGLICVVNDSGGPKLDIVTDITEDGPGGTGRTGFHATTVASYAQAFELALSLDKNEALAMRRRARRSARRFGEEQFDQKWVVQMAKLIELCSSTKGS